MKDPLGVSPSKRNQGTTRGKEKFLLTSVGIEPTTSGLDLPLLCRLSYEVGQRKSGTTSELILCSHICVYSATRHNIHGLVLAWNRTEYDLREKQGKAQRSSEKKKFHISD